MSTYAAGSCNTREIFHHKLFYFRFYSKVFSTTFNSMLIKSNQIKSGLFKHHISQKAYDFMRSCYVYVPKS